MGFPHGTGMEGVFDRPLKVLRGTAAGPLPMVPTASEFTPRRREKCTDLNAARALNVLAGIRL